LIYGDTAKVPENIREDLLTLKDPVYTSMDLNQRAAYDTFGNTMRKEYLEKVKLIYLFNIKNDRV
jgi:hypothetical protein